MSEPSASLDPEQSPRGLHLDSWKEIAAYLKRDIRTVQRWEKQEGLPVHRHQHDERGTAYAYSGEIDRWLDSRSRSTNRDETGVTATPAVTEGAGGAAAAEPASAVREQPASNPATVRAERRVMWPLLALAAITMLVAAVAIWRVRSNEPARALTTLSVAFPAEVRFQDWGPDLALSPDGATLVYAARGPFRLRRLDQLEGHTIPGTQDGRGPFFSPDGQEIGFFRPGELVRAPVEGGTPVVVADIEVDFNGGADWGRHDQIVYGAPTLEGSHGLYRVSSGGGRPQLITTIEGNSETAYWLTPQWIGDGDAVLSTVVRSSPDGTRFQAVAVSVATGKQQVLIDDARHARDIGGLLVYRRNDALFAVRFDSKRLEVTGPHVPAWENVGARIRNRSWTHAGDTLVYWPNLRRPRRLVWVDRYGREEPLSLPPGQYHAPRLSPDGRRIAVIVDDASAEFGNVWQYDLVTGATVQLTEDGRSGAIAWTPDGAHLIVAMRQGQSSDLYRMRADGGGEPERILASSALHPGAFKQPVGWIDTRNLIVSQSGLFRQSKLWSVALDGGSAPRPIVGDGGGWSGGSVSPDGRWIAYASAESGRAEVYVARLPEGRPRWRVSSDGGRLPLWARSGRELFYRNGGRMMAVPVTTVNGAFVPGQPSQLFEGDFYEVEPGGPDHDVTLDDKKFLIVQRGATDGPERLNVIQGWRSEIERRLRNAR